MAHGMDRSKGPNQALSSAAIEIKGEDRRTKSTGW